MDVEEAVGAGGVEVKAYSAGVHQYDLLEEEDLLPDVLLLQRHALSVERVPEEDPLVLEGGETHPSVDQVGAGCLRREDVIASLFVGLYSNKAKSSVKVSVCEESRCTCCSPVSLLIMLIPSASSTDAASCRQR